MAMRLRYQAGDRAFAKTHDLHIAAFIHLADGFVGGSVLDPVSDIFGVAVGEMGAHAQLLGRAGLKKSMLRQNLDAVDARLVRPRPRRSSGNPFRQHPIIQRVDLKSFSALVRDGAVGLSSIKLRPGSLGTIRRPSA